MTRRIAFRCDAGPSIGVGHVMRCLALAEELRLRGVDAVFLCEVESVPWLAEQLSVRGFATEPPPSSPTEHVRVLAPTFDGVVFDSYLLPPEVFRAVRRAGLPTMAIIDGDPRGAEGDLFVDQNVGAERDDAHVADGSRRLAGLDYALIRDDVLAMRPPAPPVARDVAVPEVLAVFGGTDTFGAGPVVVAALAATGRPFHATVVAPRDALRDKIGRIPLATGQRISVVGPTDRLAELVRDSDLVVSAAGSSTWELLALGACAALVCVADNQETGYRRLIATGAVQGLGMLTDVRRSPDDATEQLAQLLGDPATRTTQATAAWGAIDGQGRVRVADALLELVGPTRGVRSDPS